jgi:hypothetical protein
MFFKFSVAPAAASMTGDSKKLPPPLIVMPREDGPLIVKRLSVTSGSVLTRTIVPVMRGRKLIVSLRLPAAQPFVAVFVFAAVMASRRAQIPGAPGSASELTVLVAASAVPKKSPSKLALRAQSRKQCLLPFIV